ncbi:MAG TPA: SDR family NAD(P)-dependent oxidoreductase [Geobacteraceae bacterium]|mgnify:CR=1 FL=1|nr:SDR family NAD(P)-dependent oxidoreductase [Geobacteraceae bacterium]
MASDKTIRTFNGAVSIVTGGASGIGRALCEELAKRGSEVFIADRQAKLADKALDAVAANKAFIVERAWWKRYWLINRMFPSLGIDLAQKRFQEDIKSLGTR